MLDAGILAERLLKGLQSAKTEQKPGAGENELSTAPEHILEHEDSSGPGNASREERDTEDV